MTHWKHEIHLRAAWTLAKENKELLPDLCQYIATALRDIPKTLSIRGAADMANEFAVLARDPLVTVEEFDDLMNNLYDWADDQRVWIVT